MALSNDIAALIGFGCEATFWGAYCILFIVSMMLLVWRRRRTRDLNIPIVVANCALFASCTAHYALEFNHFYTTLQATGVPNFANETHTLFGADILISLSDLLGDMVLLYRCWLVWGQNYWIIILPSLTAIAGFACLMEVMHLLLTINPTAPVAPASIVPLGIAGYALPLCTNVMTTALIAGRIWWSTRTHGQPVLRSTKRATNSAMAIVVESGLLYLVTQFIFVVLFAIKHPAQAIVAVIAVQIYGIAPTLIIIRVALGISSDQIMNDDSVNSTHISWKPRMFPRSTATDFTSMAATGYTTDSGPTFQAEAELLPMKTLESDKGSAV